MIRQAEKRENDYTEVKMEKNDKPKKGFIARLIDKLDKKMKEKAKAAPCCSPKDKSKDGPCCSGQ